MNKRDTRKKMILELCSEKKYVPMKEKELAVLLQAKGKDRAELAIILKELLKEKKLQINKRGRYSLACGEQDECTLIGTFDKSGDTYGFVVPDNKKEKDIYVDIRDSMNAKDKAKVVVEITKPGTDRRAPEGKIIEILGMAGDPGMDMLSILRAFGIPDDFPEKVKNQANRIGDEIIEADTNGRTDLRAVLMVTIDGEDSKDLDDAVSLYMEGDNYILGVHIADVSNYVQENSALDHEALARGTSVYIPDRVVPMLPPKLSNGICSLNPREDRLALSCIMTISPAGKLIEYDIVESVICTDERMTYTSVAKILEDKDPWEREKYSNVVPMLDRMYELSGILRNIRKKRGSIDFDFPECGFELNEDGSVKEIFIRPCNGATKLIEDFMLMANETVAMHYSKKGVPFVYRIHEEPDEEKIQQLQAMVNSYGYHLSIKGDNVVPGEIQKLLEDTREVPESRLIATAALRSMRQAVYGVASTGHFGLAAEYYCHFTSPIRRYPDLQIHRIIKDDLRGRLNEAKIAHYEKILTEVSNQSSRMERRAVDVERECDKAKMCEYMSHHLGESFDGIITGVTEWGIYVALSNTVEGLVHISKLPGDYFIYEEENFCLTGKKTGIKYVLGQEVRVAVSAVDLALRNIDFDLDLNDSNENCSRHSE